MAKKCVDLIGSYILKGLDRKIMDCMCITIVDPKLSEVVKIVMEKRKVTKEVTLELRAQGQSTTRANFVPQIAHLAETGRGQYINFVDSPLMLASYFRNCHATFFTLEACVVHVHNW